MVYRFLAWIKSLLSKLGLINSNVMCQMCGKNEPYSSTSLIKVRHNNGAIFDMVICKPCGDRLENLKKKKLI